MTKTTIHSSISNLESCRSRLADRRRRQLRLRQVLVHHLLGENKKLSLIGSSSGDEFTDVYTQVNLSQKLSQCLGVWNNQLHNYNEEAKLKALIMPVVRRLKEPRLSAAAVRFLNKLISENESSSYTITNGCILRVERPTKSTTTQSTNGRNLNDSSYTGSSTFLKGTQSANPHNDYCQHLVDTGERPQNFIRDTGLKNRFEEYPKLRELIRLKDELISVRATPPMYLRTDLLNFDLHELNSVFDVILVEPPLEEYNKVTGVVNDRFWSWLEVERLEIEKIAAPRSFIWIWCGSGEGLDGARKCLRKWGYRRCEDICWIKTNKTRPVHEQLEPGAVFQRTKEHCLMGIHGTVRRSTDGDFIHANLDIDLIISEAKPTDSYAAKDKPAEIFHIIEHFCQGRRRLHLFGRDSTLRAGWLTVGSELSASNFDSSVYNSYFVREPSNGHLLGSSEEIERLRPKSPPPRFPGGGNQRTSSATAPPQSVAVANAMSAMLGTGTWSSATSNASFDAQKNQTGSRRLGSSSIPTTTTTHSRFRLNNNNNGTNGNNNAASDLIWRGNTSSNIFSSSSNSDNPLINMLLANQRRAQLNTNDMPVSLPSAWPLVSTSLTKNNSLLLNAISNATTASRNSSLAALQAAAVMMSGLQQQNSQYQHNQYHLRLAQQQTQSIMNSHLFRNNPLDVFSAPSSGVLPNPFAGLVTSANDNSGFLGNNNNKTAMALQLFAAAASLRSSSAILPGSSSFTDSDSTSTSSDIGRRSGHR